MTDSQIQTGDGSFEADAAAAEAAKIETARTELVDEALPAGEGLIMGKYSSTDEVVEAFQVVGGLLVGAVVLLADHQLVRMGGDHRVIFRSEQGIDRSELLK